MVGAQCVAFSLLTSLTNATTTSPRKSLKPLLSSSISIPLPPKKLKKRKNHLRPKILKTLTKPLSIEPIIPTTSPPPSDTVLELQPNELGGIVPAFDEVEEVQVMETEGVASEYSGSFGKLSAMSVLKVGLGLVGLLVLQTICTVCFLGNSNADEKNKKLDALDKGINGINRGNVLLNEDGVYSDRAELEYKINEIRAMAREVRKIEEDEEENGDEEGGSLDEIVNSKGRIGIEREIFTRLSNLQKKLNSGKGKSPLLYMDISNEIEDVEDAKKVDKTLIFKKKFKFRSPSTGLRTDAKGFSSFKDGAAYEKKKRGIAGANGDSSDRVSRILEGGKNGSKASSRDSNRLQKEAEKLVKEQKETGVGNTDKRSLVDGMESRKVKDMEVEDLQNFTEEKQETAMRSDKDALLDRSGGSFANIVRDDLSAIKCDLWWLNLPYVLAILMRRGLDLDGPAGLFTLRATSQVQDQTEISYTVAFEDRGDANNFCYILESFFEDLGDFSADIVPLYVKELHDGVKSGTKKMIVVKKRQLKLYAGQPLADVEKALFLLIEQSSSISATNVM